MAFLLRNELGDGPPKRLKHVWFIRHGNSEFNAWRVQTAFCPWTRLCHCCCAPLTTFVEGLRDAPLSAKGEAQVARLRTELIAQKLPQAVDLVVASPLTRAIQTSLAFEGLLAASGKPLVVGLHRELVGSSCDIGAPSPTRHPLFLHVCCVVRCAPLSALSAPLPSPPPSAPLRSPLHPFLCSARPRCRHATQRAGTHLHWAGGHRPQLRRAVVGT